MSAKEFEDYIAIFVSEYGADVQKAYQVGPEEAKEFAQKTIDTSLPDGQFTRWHSILKVCDGNLYVGVIWFKEEGSHLFVMDVFVFEPFRHKEYGTKIFEKLEEIARAKNMGKMTLYVFSWNTYALKLYKHMKFKPVRLYMEKILK